MKSIPAFAATSRKRMGGGGPNAAAARVPARAGHAPVALFTGRPDLGLTRPHVLLFLDSFHDLLILCHRGARLFRLARGAVGAGQLIVQAAVVIQFQGLLQMGDGLGMFTQAREASPSDASAAVSLGSAARAARR